MEILKCPKCSLAGGALYFKPKRAGGRPYPKVKHYKPSKKSRESWCNISAPNLSKIEFRDLKLNAWKSVLDPKDWYKIPGLASRYSNIDSYIHRSDIENIHEEFLNIMDREMTWLKKCSVPGKEPIAFTYDGDIVQMPKTPSTIIDLLRLVNEIKKFLEKNNDDPEKVLDLTLFHNRIVLAHNIAFAVRDRVIRRVPLEDATIMHKIRKNKRIITAKQKIRILKRHTREVLPIFDPNNRDEALAAQFYGIQCPNKKCRSWRTDLVPAGRDSKGMCHACGTTGFEVGIRPDCPQCHRPFYDSIVREMIKTAVDDGDRILTRCIYCKEEVYFPKKHVEIFSDVLLI